MRKIKFADIGEGIHEGVLRKWAVQEGDEVKEGQTLFLIETDKVTAEIPSPTDGTVTSLDARVGETVKVGQTVLIIDDNAEQQAEDKRTETVTEQGSTSVVGKLEISSEVIAPSEEGGPAPIPETGPPRKVRATPVARKLAKDSNVDITTIQGTGPAGRIMKEDIRRAAGRQKVPVAETVRKEDETIPMTMLRKTIARNMVLSKTTIPHAAAMDEVDVSGLVRLREQMKPLARAEGVHLTFMAFILKAVARALKAHPRLNASLDENGENIVLKKAVNIGIAVDTPKGLIVPVVHQADAKSILELAAETERLAESCRDHTVKIEDLRDGTFSITNYGASGSLYGLPIIKPPEAAILGVGSIAKKPVVAENGVVVRDMVTLTLCFDHRIVDGGDAGRFMNELKKLLSQPLWLVMK